MFVCIHLFLLLLFIKEQSGNSSGTVAGMGYSGYSDALSDRGANLKDYFTKREEQEAKAVSLLLTHPSSVNVASIYVSLFIVMIICLNTVM